MHRIDWPAGLSKFCLGFAAAAAVLAFCVWAWWPQAGNVVSSLFFERDFWRAAYLLEGREIPLHGPELTGGGRTIGPFFYYLLASALFFGQSLSSILVLYGLLLVFTFAGVAAVLWKKCGAISALLFLLLLFSSPILTQELKTLWNPSFLPFFLLSAYLLLWKYSEAPLGIAGAGILLGLSVQLHGSAFPASFGVILGLVVSRKNWRIPVALLFGFIASIALCKLPAIFSNAMEVESSSGLLAALQAIRDRFLLYPLSELIRSQNVRSMALRFFCVILFPLGALLHLARLGAPRRELAPIWGGTLASAIAVPSYILEGGTARYGIPYALGIALLLAAYFPALLRAERRKRALGLSLLVGILIFSGLCRQLDNKRFGPKENFTTHDNQRLCQAAGKLGIYDPALLHFRIYSAGVDIARILPSLCFGPRGAPVKVEGNPVAGIIVVAAGEGLLWQLPEDFRQEIKSGQIAIEDADSVGNQSPRILLYRIGAGSSFPSGISNLGAGYPNVNQGFPLERSVILAEPKGKMVASLKDEATDFSAELWESESEIDVIFASEASVRVHLSVNPAKGLAFLRPALVWHCRGERKEFVLADYMGTRVPAWYPTTTANSLLVSAPVHRRFPKPCALANSRPAIAWQNRFEISREFYLHPSGAAEMGMVGIRRILPHPTR